MAKFDCDANLSECSYAEVMSPFYEELTITKTEVKEEPADFETITNGEFAKVEDVDASQYCLSSTNDIKEEDVNFELYHVMKQEASENVDFATNIVDMQECKQEKKDQKKINAQCFNYKRHKMYSPVYWKSNLSKHVLGTTRPYRCRYCEYSDRFRWNVINHVQIHRNEKLFKCIYKKCKFTAGCKDKIKRHLSTAHRGKRYKCEHCPYSTSFKAYLKSHVAIHSNKKSFKCTYINCRFATINKAYLNRHISMRHSDKQEKYKCEDCEFSAPYKRLVKSHRSEIHLGEKSHKCIYRDCEFTTLGKAELKKHMVSKHVDAQKRFVCKHCEFWSHKKFDLTIHKRTHYNEKCLYENCGFITTRNHFLKLHLAMKHGEGPCKCTYANCSYSTVTIDSLKIHISLMHSDAQK